MAPPSSDMKPPSPKEHGDTGRTFQQEHPQTVVPDSPAAMSAARDIADDTGATTKKDLPHANQQPPEATKTTNLEVPDDLSSIRNEKHLPPSTPSFSAERSKSVDKATDITTPVPDSPRSEDPLSSVNKLGSPNKSAGTSLSSDGNLQNGKSISPGRASRTFINAKDPVFSGGNHLHDSTTFSLANTLQGDGESNDTSVPAPRKRKHAASSIDKGVAEGQPEKPKGKKLRSSAASFMSTATEKAEIEAKAGASKAQESPKSSQQSKTKLRLDRPSDTQGPPPTRKKANKARQPASQVQPQHALSLYVSPIDSKINALSAVVGAIGQAHLCREAAPLPNDRELRLGAYDHELDLSAMEPFMFMGAFQTTGGYKRNHLCRSLIIVLFTSNGCAPALRQWKLACYDDPTMESQLPFALLGSDLPGWAKEMHQLASCAMHYHAIVNKTMKFKSKQRRAIMRCAKFVRRLVHCNSPYIMHYLNMCKFPDAARFLFHFYAGMLITAYENFVNHPGGFFEILLNSPFASGITAEARPSWLPLLGLSYADKDSRHINPVEDVQRAALACGATTLSKKPVGNEKLVRVTEPYYDSSARFTRLHKAFHQEASRYVHLLTPTNNQVATSVLPQQMPPHIENHKNICTMPSCKNNHSRTPVLQDDEDAENVLDQGGQAPLPTLGAGYEDFALSQGRMVPSRVLVANVGAYDLFTKQEELILYKRFKAVITASPPGHQDVAEFSSEAWWEFWAKVAEVLPGRGVMKCIAFYVANKEHFQHT